ncbi:hypothetical protein K7566_09665 [Stenotrophomonas maltophilia]|uniref:hypothetical protein n=1 Tax=Stenotrophomonas maltophilia TaxID=40324 RepID=UPI001D1066BC|nr:hypothetical protein [Stenotrophomonas maltophilia]UXB21943.1 hypothetical protein K7566_09665 [Stenotrophomonas maltophilia]
MAEAKTNAGSKLYICATPKNTYLPETEFKALTFAQVKKVGSIGERGISTNIVQYDTLDTLVALKGKGITNAGDPQVEVAEDLTDPGQVALRAAGDANVPDAYAFKVERADGSIEYRLEARARVTCRFRRESTGAVGRSPHEEM